MDIVKKIVLTILVLSLLSSCEFIKNTFTYKEKTKDFIEIILNEDYDKAVEHFAIEHEMFRNTDITELKNSLPNFREHLIKNFGRDYEYTFMKSEKKFSTREEENTPPNTTVALIQFSNGKEFGVFKVLFDDKSGKIININTLDIKQQIPSMIFFWIFGLLALCVPIFNIYVIRQVKRSDLKKKWLKYIAIIFLNIPTITYAAVSGFSFNLLSFQILLGVSFGYMGFLLSYWSFGIPLGGLYWFWRIKHRKNIVTDNEITSTQDSTIEENNEPYKLTTE